MLTSLVLINGREFARFHLPCDPGEHSAFSTAHLYPAHRSPNGQHVPDQVVAGRWRFNCIGLRADRQEAYYPHVRLVRINVADQIILHDIDGRINDLERLLDAVKTERRQRLAQAAKHGQTVRRKDLEEPCQS